MGKSYKLPIVEVTQKIEFSLEDEEKAAERLERFSPYIVLVFPETQSPDGVIDDESSTGLFMGYAEVARRLKQQLEDKNSC